MIYTKMTTGLLTISFIRVDMKMFPWKLLVVLMPSKVAHPHKKKVAPKE